MTVPRAGDGVLIGSTHGSNHVRVLRDAGIVGTGQKAGKEVGAGHGGAEDILGRLGQVFGPAAAEPLH